jgi:hypothetical protein
VSEIRVDSRWWYWVAAIPVVAAFWAVSALWVAVVVLVVPEADPTAFGAVVSTPGVTPNLVELAVVAALLPGVALGVPALALVVALPLALWRDAQEIEAAGGNWPADPTRPPKFAVAGLVAILASLLLFFEGELVGASLPALGLVGLLAGVVGETWLCVRYVRERREVVDMPSSLWEWRDELSEETGRR